MKNCKAWKKRVASALLSLVLVAALLPACLTTEAEAVVSTSWGKLNGSTGGQTIGTNGQTKYYYIDANTTCSNSNTGGSHGHLYAGRPDQLRNGDGGSDGHA